MASGELLFRQKDISIQKKSQGTIAGSRAPYLTNLIYDSASLCLNSPYLWTKCLIRVKSGRFLPENRFMGFWRPE